MTAMILACLVVVAVLVLPDGEELHLTCSSPWLLSQDSPSIMQLTVLRSTAQNIRSSVYSNFEERGSKKKRKRYHRNCFLLTAATGVVIYSCLFLLVYTPYSVLSGSDGPLLCRVLFTFFFVSFFFFLLRLLVVTKSATACSPDLLSVGEV